MKTLVLFYSYTGHTKARAQSLAEEESADLAEIKDVRRPGKLKAYTAGCLASRGGKVWPIQPLSLDWEAYDRLILLSPVWAGRPTPAVNALLEQLPSGKSVSVKMVSGGGQSGCKSRMEAALQAKGCTLESFEDFKN